MWGIIRNISFLVAVVITITMLSIVINYYEPICKRETNSSGSNYESEPTKCPANREKTTDENARFVTAGFLLAVVLILLIVSFFFINFKDPSDYSKNLALLILSIILIIVKSVTIFYPANETNMRGSGSYWTFFSLSIVVSVCLITSLVLVS